MPRFPRKKSKTGIYHIMIRGINKQIIFEDDEDRLRLLKTIKRFKSTCKYQIFGYCLMDNHIHLLIKETDETISVSIQRILSSYVYWYNNKYDRVGHLFQERFKSECVETTAYFLTVLRYIHQNPIKAGLAANISETKWTSIHEYTQNSSNIIDIDFPLSLFSSNKNTAIRLFLKFTEEPNDDSCLDEQVRKRLTDEEIVEYLSRIGITTMSTFQKMHKAERDDLILKLRELEGVSIRQLSRVTGISKSVIDRIR